MDNLELLIDFHKNAARQGPGSDADTLLAVSISRLDKEQPLRIADIGCGTGAQTLALARHTNWHITGIDLFPEFLQPLREQSQQAGLSAQVSPLEASMDALEKQGEGWDAIWSEGAIYNIGFRKGLQLWRPLLKPHGVIAVSELTWTTPERPEELQQYWQEAYPEVGTMCEKLTVLEEEGYQPLGSFSLPPSSWEDTYYEPMEGRFGPFLEKHGHSAEALSLVESERKEIDLHRRHQRYISYGYYIARRVD